MSKFDLAKLAKSIQSTASKHAPEILTGIGIAGMFTTTVLAVKATPKALRLIEDARYDKGEALTATEKAKACWKCYIPSAVTGVASAACLIGATSVSARRTAALAAAYQISETALSEYREKVVETIGEKKERQIREKVNQERVEKNPVSKNEVIITPKGHTLCYDAISGRYFWSDIDAIKKAINELNRRMVYEMYISLNELYDELNLDHTGVGDQLGWSLDDGTINPEFSSHIADDGNPCIVLDYERAPRYDYNKLVR